MTKTAPQHTLQFLQPAVPTIRHWSQMFGMYGNWFTVHIETQSRAMQSPDILPTVQYNWIVFKTHTLNCSLVCDASLCILSYPIKDVFVFDSSGSLAEHLNPTGRLMSRTLVFTASLMWPRSGGGLCVECSVWGAGYRNDSTHWFFLIKQETDKKVWIMNSFLWPVTWTLSS